MFSKWREPVSGLTHLIGAILSFVGLVILIILSVTNHKMSQLISFTIFGVSLILLYLASTIYHSVNFSEKAIKILRKLDHSMIYVLIAGTYTPVCIVGLRGMLGYGLLIAIWFMAIVGITIKMFWMDAPRWLYTTFYLIMGWLSIIIVAPLSKVVSVQAIMWLATGGIMYTVGAVIYAVKKPNLKFKYFGFHEIFHVFVLLGSFCHYWFMLKYIMNIYIG